VSDELEDDGVTDAPVIESKIVMSAEALAVADLEELVESARHGDDGAFGELVQRTHADTYALARRLVSNDDDALDVVQDAYLRAYRSLSKFRGDAQFTTWMYRITANCASTYLGRRRRHQHGDLGEIAEVADPRPENDPAAAADSSTLRDRLEEAVAALPPRLRAVVVLRDIYDMSHSEIAEELGISESAAKVRLHRARRRLRAEVFPLKNEGATSNGEEHARAV